MKANSFMARKTFDIRAGAVLALIALSAGCTLKKQDTPSLTGPSELGTSVSISVSPERLIRNGTSQSLVSVMVRDANGQPLSNASLRAQVYAGGQPVLGNDLGTLSAQSLVTDTSGRASMYYTAPKTPGGLNQNTMVQVGVAPVQSDAANTTPRFAQIELVPDGVGGVPTSPLSVAFTPLTANIGDPVVFTASVSGAGGVDASDQVSSFLWNFGDGKTASGRIVSHTFSDPGTPTVTLTVTDLSGRMSYASNRVTVGQGTLPTAVFTYSPLAPTANTDIFFNATQSVPAPGRRIVSYTWNFGDGSPEQQGVQVIHRYSLAGQYVVTLVVEDDLGRTSVTTGPGSIDVGTGGTSSTGSLVANFRFSRVGTTAAFTDTSAGGATAWSWNFGDPTSDLLNTSTAQNPSHAFTGSGTFNVSLTVSDGAGNSANIIKAVTIQ
jgi:PKD repeat protein